MHKGEQEPLQKGRATASQVNSAFSLFSQCTYSAATDSHSSPRRRSSTSPGITILTISHHQPHVSE